MNVTQNYGNPQTTGYAVPAPPRSLDSVTTGLSESIKRAVDLRDRARSIADDVFGGVNTSIAFTNQNQSGIYVSGSGTGMAISAPRSRMATIDEQVVELSQVLSALSVEIDRLTCL